MKALMGGMAGGQQGMPGGPGDKKEMSPEDEWKSTLNCGNAMELSNRMAGLASQINEQAVSGLGQVPGFHTTGPLGPVVKKTTKYVPLPAPFAAASNNHVAQEYAKMNYNRFKEEIAAAKKEQEKMKKMQAKQEEEMMKQIMKVMKQSGDKEEKQDTKGGEKKAPEPKVEVADKKVAEKKETKQQQQKKPAKATPKVQESKAEKEKVYQAGDPQGISDAIEDIAQTLAKLSIG